MNVTPRFLSCRTGPVHAPPARGFTLVELLIVLAIVAIVSAFAVPAYGDYVERTKIASALGKLREMHQRMDQYYANNRSYDNGSGRCDVPNYDDPESDFSLRCGIGGGGQRLAVFAVGQRSMAGFRYTIDDSGLERTLSVPPGWTSVTVPVNRFLMRKE